MGTSHHLNMYNRQTCLHIPALGLHCLVFLPHQQPASFTCIYDMPHGTSCTIDSPCHLALTWQVPVFHLPLRFPLSYHHLLPGMGGGLLPPTTTWVPFLPAFTHKCHLHTLGGSPSTSATNTTTCHYFFCHCLPASTTTTLPVYPAF